MVSLPSKSNNYNQIVQHEDEMLERYSKIIAGYSLPFSRYNCSLNVGRIWINALTNEKSNFRLPFQSGYSCYVYCDVIKDGKILRSYITNGEVDYYELSAIWSVSFIQKRCFRLNTTLWSMSDAVEEEIRVLLEYVQTMGQTDSTRVPVSDED